MSKYGSIMIHGGNYRLKRLNIGQIFDFYSNRLELDPKAKKETIQSDVAAQINVAHDVIGVLR